MCEAKLYKTVSVKSKKRSAPTPSSPCTQKLTQHGTVL